MSKKRNMNRVGILVSSARADVADECVAALASNPGNIFSRGGELVRIVKAGDPDTSTKVKAGDKPKESPFADGLPVPSLEEYLTRIIDFQTTTEDDQGVLTRRSIHVPKWVAGYVHSRGEWSAMRKLAGISEYPFIREDGSVCQEQGYDVATGVFCHFNDSFPAIPETPSPEEVVAARDLLLEVVVDVPFEKEHHRAAWLSAILTLVGRHSFHGQAPMFVFDANTPGCGKGLIMDVCGIIMSGHKFQHTSQPMTEEEWQKRVISLLMAAPTAVVIDEICAPLGGPTLNNVLTAETFQGRVLGQSRMVGYPTTSTVWMAAGNNIPIKNDIMRRIIPIRLESPEERPEERTNFKHPDLLGWVTKNRKKLLASALVILRAHALAGRPQNSIGAYGSFEAWSTHIRAAVVWLGLPDPHDGRLEIAKRVDTDRGFILGMIEILEVLTKERKGITAAEMIVLAERGEQDKRSSMPGVSDGPNVVLANLLSTIAKNNKPLPDARSLGVKLDKISGRVVSGRRVIARPEYNRTGKLWTVISATAAVVPLEEDEKNRLSQHSRNDRIDNSSIFNDEENDCESCESD